MMKKLLTLILSLTSASALAHSGHLPDESVHGLLHIEHIIGLIVFAFVAYAVANWINK